jgi:hypothetical protein
VRQQQQLFAVLALWVKLWTGWMEKVCGHTANVKSGAGEESCTGQVCISCVVAEVRSCK